jgi:hypothetical protein
MTKYFKNSNQFFFLLFGVIFLATLLSGCYYDKEELLYPDGVVCDTVAVSYNADVQAILQLRCNGCHGGAFPSAGIDLTTHENVLIYANGGGLLGSIRHESGFSPMPKSAPKIPVCEINKISAWINNGAPNN